MKNNSIELLEATPKLHSKKCKIIAFLIRVTLENTTFIAAALTWYLYDYFIAGAVLLLAFIIMGIIRSKLRNSSIPVSQQEYHYNDKGIAEWYVSKNICFDD